MAVIAIIVVLVGLFLYLAMRNQQETDTLIPASSDSASPEAAGDDSTTESILAVDPSPSVTEIKSDTDLQAASNDLDGVNLDSIDSSLADNDRDAATF